MCTLQRKQEIIDKCLEVFTEKGLAHTTTRDLCDALNLNSGGIFYWFKTKDEIVFACAKEAKERIEKDLFGSAINEIQHPDKLAKNLYQRANVMRPLMQFFVSVCTSPQYKQGMQPLLDNLSKGYKSYIQILAKKVSCEPEELAPYAYIVIDTMLTYMLVGTDNFCAPQLTLVYNKLVSLIEAKNNKK